MQSLKVVLALCLAIFIVTDSSEPSNDYTVPISTGSVVFKGPPTIAFDIFVPSYDAALSNAIDLAGWTVMLETSRVKFDLSAALALFLDKLGSLDLFSGKLPAWAIASYVQQLNGTVAPVALQLRTKGSSAVIQVNLGPTLAPLYSDGFRLLSDFGWTSADIAAAIGGDDALFEYDVKMFIDARHLRDPWAGYISVSPSGSLVFSPKIYSADDIQVIVRKRGFTNFLFRWQVLASVRPAMAISIPLPLAVSQQLLDLFPEFAFQP